MVTSPETKHRLTRLPRPISHFLGYRPSAPLPPPRYAQIFWMFVAAFCGISVLQAIFGHAHYFIERGVPPIIASYGASAVLIYGAIEAPLAQPRALVGGHFIGALIGVCVNKLFALLPTYERYLQLQWLSGSISVATTIVLMDITATTHPPAGATALLATVNEEVIEMSWYFIPVILLSSAVSLVVALLINNIQRRYPVFWLKPIVPPHAKPSEDLQPSEGPLEEEKGDAPNARANV